MIENTPILIFFLSLMIIQIIISIILIVRTEDNIKKVIILDNEINKLKHNLVEKRIVNPKSEVKDLIDK